MQRAVLGKTIDFSAKRLLRNGLAAKSGALILSSLVSIFLLPSHPAVSQSPIFHGVRVPQGFDANSDLADLIKKSVAGQQGFPEIGLGEWVVIPGTEDNYYTYEVQEITVRTTFRSYVIFLLVDSTTNNPKHVSFGVDCAENKLRPIRYRGFSPRGTTSTNQALDEPWTTPSNNFWQGLVNGVCSLGS
jgi:hypothetical protein